MKRGFTLVEFLIVIGILSLSIGSILLILTTVVKGANQANINAEVKANGQNVLDTLSGIIRGASEVYQLNGQMILGQSAPLPSGAESAIWIWTSTGERLTIACIEAASSNPTENGRIMILSGGVSSSPPLNLDGFQPISNTDVVNGVDIDCEPSTSITPNALVVSSTTASSKVVLVNFTAKQGVAAPSRVDFNASAQFKTAISLRQYQ